MLVTPVSIKNVHTEGEKAYDRKENEDENGKKHKHEGHSYSLQFT